MEPYEWRTGRACVYKNYYHLVFVTKYRKSVFSDKSLLRMKEVLEETCLQMKGELLEFNGEDNHVHLLVIIPTSTAVCHFVGKLKGKTAYILRKEFYSELKTKLWGAHLWSPSYCSVTCGGAPLDIIKQYITDQNRPPSEKAVLISKRENRVNSPGGDKVQSRKRL